MVVAPADTPVTTPDDEFTEPTAGVLLLQVPPVPAELDSVIWLAMITVLAPEMVPALAAAFTVTT